VSPSNLPGLANAVRLPPGALTVAPGNPRIHEQAQIDQIIRSVRTFGWTNPILIDERREVIAGEARLIAARQMGLAHVPCIILPGLTAAQRRAYRVADNRIALNAGWDDALLQAVMLDLDAIGFNLPILGFADAEVARLLEPAPPANANDPDQGVAIAPGDPVTQLGDLWTLGDHRLICGDSTSSEVMARLFGRGSAAVVLVTDPPYGMAYDSAKHGMILNDDLKGSALTDLVAGAIAAGLPHIREGGSLYVCLTWRTWFEFELAMRRIRRPINACIVWDKGSIGLGSQHYRPQHEFIFYSQGDRWHGGRTEGDVWTLSRGNTSGYVHPTQKPVELLERAVRNSSRRGDVVLDLFGGSGSTLIACERAGRSARLCELDPKYCDAIVKRWELYTGRKAVRAAA